MNCRTCGAELIPGTVSEGGNWTKDRQQSQAYECTPCNAPQNCNCVSLYGVLL